MKRLIIVLALLTIPALALAQQTKTFNSFIQSLPQATTPLTGTEPMIVLQNGSTKQTPNSSVHSSLPGVIDVTSYGAKCDGVTDDTTAIRSAVTAAGGSVTAAGQYAMKILSIPGLCLVTGTITIRNPNNGGVAPFVVQCSGGTSGLVWGGTDNTGPMLTFGDINNVVLDDGLAIKNCTLESKDPTHRPNIALLLANVQSVTFDYGGISGIINGIQCQNQCLLTNVFHTFFNCYGTCIQSFFNVGGRYADNNFLVCGTWCVNSLQDGSLMMLNNYFAGNVAGALGSVLIASTSVKMIGNSYEDQSVKAGPNFLSVKLAQGSASFDSNVYIGGCGVPPNCPNYFIQIGDGASAVAEFHSEFINGGVGASGFIINNTRSEVSSWFGGIGCLASQVWTGAGKNYQQLVAACSHGEGSVYEQGSFNNGFAANGDRSTGGQFYADAIIGRAGNRPVYSGACAATFVAGNQAAGSFQASGSCTAASIVATYTSAAPSGFACTATDQTTPANTVKQTASTVTSVSYVATVATNDVISFQCIGY